MIRITYKQWAALGGFRNPDLCRKMRGNRWTYWKGVTK